MEIVIKKYNDVWLDNGVATLYYILEKLSKDSDTLQKLKLDATHLVYEFNNFDEFVEEFAEEIRNQLPNLKVEGKDKITKERKEYKKDYILAKENRNGANITFIEHIFKPEKTQETVKQIYENLDGEKYNCFFCNRPFKKNVKKIQQASYPFVTKIQSLSGIRSGRDHKFYEYISEYCPQCYLNGIIEWLDDTIVYSIIPRNKSIIILPNTESLSDLVQLKKRFRNLLNNQERRCNIKIDSTQKKVDSPPGRYTTFLSFYENFLRDVEPQFDHNNWYIIEIPSGSVKNPKVFNILLKDKIVNILNILIRQEKTYFYHLFVHDFYAFYTDPKKGIRDSDRKKDLHEQLCRSLVDDDFAMFASTFMPRKGVRVGIPKESYQILNKLIYYWRIKPMQIENKEEYLKTLGMASTTLANLIGRRLNLFFKLEKAKNPNQFFEALQEISRRLMIDETEKVGKVYTHSLEKISQLILEHMDDKEFFNTTKNILLIFTSLRSNKKESTTEKESSNEQ